MIFFIAWGFRGFSQVLKAWSWIASGCHSWVALLHSINFKKAATVSWPASMLRCNTALLLLYALCKAVPWSLGHWDDLRWLSGDKVMGPALMPWIWCILAHTWAPPDNVKCWTGWHRVNGNSALQNLLSYLVASSSLQAEDPAEQYPCVTATFSVPVQGGFPAVMQSRTYLLLPCSSRSPSRGGQDWVSCLFFSLSLVSHQQAKINPWQFLPGLPDWSFSISMMQQVFSSGHRSLFLFCGRRFNYSASEPHPSFPVQSPSRAFLCILGTWSHRILMLGLCLAGFWQRGRRLLVWPL